MITTRTLISLLLLASCSPPELQEESEPRTGLALLMPQGAKLTGGKTFGQGSHFINAPCGRRHPEILEDTGINVGWSFVDGSPTYQVMFFAQLDLTCVTVGRAFLVLGFQEQDVELNLPNIDGARLYVEPVWAFPMVSVGALAIVYPGTDYTNGQGWTFDITTSLATIPEHIVQCALEVDGTFLVSKAVRLR